MALGASGRRWAVATPHRAATEAAAEAFERGGNAIDASIGAATTLAVVCPHLCGVGGDLFALLQHPQGDVLAIASAGAAPAGIDADDARRTYETMPERGPLTVVVPGAVAGWVALHARGAQLPWADAFESAIRYAADGVRVGPGLGHQLSRHAGFLADDPGFAAAFFPHGVALSPADLLVQPSLARSLEAIAAGGADAFYRGPVGAALAEGLRACGSPLTQADLAVHSAEFLPPITARFLDLDVRSAPPPSQGFVMLEAMLAIERLGLDPDPLGPDAGQLAIAFAAAASDRDRYLADPAFMRVHPQELLADGHIEAVCGRIRAGLGGPIAPLPVDGDTAGLVAVDSRGFAVSLIQSLAGAFGSGILEPETGVIAQNRGSGFTLEPDHPNSIGPRKRPAHTLMPVVAHREGRLAALCGTRGGAAHPQLNTWSLVRTFQAGMAPAEAVDAPRWIIGGIEGIAGVADAESGVPQAVLDQIERAGFQLRRLGAVDPAVGHANLIRISGDGLFEAGADPRAEGAAMAM